MKVLVTGATGLIGSALVPRLRASGYPVVAASRRPSTHLDGALTVRVTDAGPDADWRGALAGIEVLIHAAARVHEAPDASPKALAEFRRVNTAGTLNLARQAVQAGVRRFVFLSTVKVNGESSAPDRPFRPDDPPAPADAYAISKREAEDGLRAIAADSTMEVVIVRPPLVYGPGARANFLRLMQWVDRGVPLPLANVDNRRSLIGLGNLVDFLAACVEHPAAAGQTFLVSDGEDLSTAGLVRRLALALDRQPRLFPVPRGLLQSLLPLLGGADLHRRLFGSLQVDSRPARERLGWRPSFTVDEGLAETARWYRSLAAVNPRESSPAG